LIRRAPKNDRPVIVSDLTALAARLQSRGAKNQAIAIYQPTRDNSAGWHVFKFTPAT
jgi:hypothetical protein